MRFFLLLLIFFVNGLFVSVHAGAQTGWKWSLGTVGSNMYSGRLMGYGQPTVVTDGYGNLYFSGINESDTVIFGTDTICNPGNWQQLIIAKIDSMGNYQWVVSSQGTWISPFNTAVDDSGNLYVELINTGKGYIDSFYFATNSTQTFILKISPAGKLLPFAMAPVFSGFVTQPSYFQGMGVDSEGYLYIAGGFSAGVFITKYNPTGGRVWTKTIDGNVATGSSGGQTGNILINNLAVAKNGDVTISGFSGDSIRIGDTIVPNMPDFIARFDNAGNFKWIADIVPFEYNYYAGPNAIALDDSGNVFLAGGVDSSILVKYSSSGYFSWERVSGGNNQCLAQQICVDKCGDVWICGPVYGDSISFDSTVLGIITNDYNPLFVAEYDGNGNCLCGMVLISGGGDAGYGYSGIAADNFGNLLIGGPYDGAMILGADTINTGQNELYFGKYHYDMGCVAPNVTPVVPPVNYFANNFSFFPNPATTQLTIQSTDSINHVQITNLLGQTVYSRQYAVGTLQCTVDVSALPCAMYFLQVNGSTTRKFVKE